MLLAIFLARIKVVIKHHVYGINKILFVNVIIYKH